MLTDNLFKDVLILPARRGANQLFVVSGYATAAMVFHHNQELKNHGIEVDINLIIGMAPVAGISRANHEGFKNLVAEQMVGRFDCRYVANEPQVHSKIYFWSCDDRLSSAFVGSANYTQQAFCSGRQSEIMEICSAEEAKEYYYGMRDRSIKCTHPDAEDMIGIYTEKQVEQYRKYEGIEGLDYDMVGLEHVKISLLGRGEELGNRSGLNWGQRPEYNRDPNQAYIRVPVDIQRMGFFPPRGIHFTIKTDDDKTLICTRAQDGGKAIEAPHNNSLIGEYFRYRLEVANGELITLKHLHQYGRTDLDFYKIDDETYYMDFSV